MAPLLILSFLSSPSQAQIQKPPVAAVHSVSDTYYGQTVVDPYRWLENLQSPEVKDWMKAQADYTRAVLDSMPGRKQFAAEMERYLNAPEAAISNVQVAGSYIFYRKRLRGHDQESLYVRDAAGGPERMLLDVEKLSTPGHHVSLDQYNPSDDGKYVVVGLSPGGSEIKTAHIYEFANALGSAVANPQNSNARVTPDFAWAVKEAAGILVRLFHPMMPHLAEECWAVLGQPGLVSEANWPQIERDLLVEDSITLVVQVNGKKRGEVTVAKAAQNAEIEAAVLSLDAVKLALGGKPVRKVIVVPMRIVNVVG